MRAPQSNCCSIASLQCGLQFAKSVWCTPVPDPLSIAEPLQVTLKVRGREVAEDDDMYGERFLLHSGQVGVMQVFSANTKRTTGPSR